MPDFEFVGNEVIVRMPIEDAFMINGTIENEMIRAQNSGIPDKDWYVRMARVRANFGTIVEIVKSSEQVNRGSDNPKTYDDGEIGDVDVEAMDKVQAELMEASTDTEEDDNTDTSVVDQVTEENQ